MAEVTAKLVAELRKLTSAGLMDCKKALTETDGDIEKAVDVLRAQGTIKAAKKADREANEGIISHYIQPDSKAGILVEINCETDFVAKNDSFVEFAGEIARLKLSDEGVHSDVECTPRHKERVLQAALQDRVREKLTQPLCVTGKLRDRPHAAMAWVFQQLGTLGCG